MQVVLITGASSGIGLALVKKLTLYPEYKVVATARKESLSRLLNENIPNVDCRPLNILSEEERVGVIKQLEVEYGGISILINNAGVSFRSAMEDMSEKEELLQICTNYLAPMELIKCSLPSIRKNHGRIINISSVSGMMAMPTMGSYSASKFALEGASESLWYELKPWKIPVTLVEPGFVRSDSYQRVIRSAKSNTETRYAPMYKDMELFVGKMMNRAIATPESIAEKIFDVMKSKNPPIRLIPSIDARFFFYLRRFLPRDFYHWILYRTIPNIKKWEQHAIHNT